MDDKQAYDSDMGEFGDSGNPDDARTPKSPAAGEFGGEGNPPGLRPEDAEPEENEAPKHPPRP